MEKPALGGAAPPGIGLRHDAVDLIAVDVSDPPDLRHVSLRATRATIWRTLRMDRPCRLKSATSTMASSPSSSAVSSPSRHQISAPSSPQPITAGTQACRAASSRNAWIAPGHASGSPIGSPLASITPDTTR